jgi:hypothetical protein
MEPFNKKMNSATQTLSFPHVFLKKRFANIPVQSHELRQSDATLLTIDEYNPDKKYHSTIGFTRGITPNRHKDERILKFCNAMTSIGFHFFFKRVRKIS